MRGGQATRRTGACLPTTDAGVREGPMAARNCPHGPARRGARGRDARRAGAWTLCVLLALVTGSAEALNLAVPYVGADSMWALGYTGAGVEVGVIDGYLADPNHPSLAAGYLGYEKFAHGPSLLDDHATSVAGAAVGRDGTYTGVAPGAGWWTAETVNRRFLTTVRDQTNAAETFARGLESLAGNPVEVITMSIGIGGTDNGADQWSLALDHIVNTNGRTITVAAGNDGPGAGSMSGIPPAAYNVITVGATGGTGGATSEDYSQLAPYSSRGPTADGRNKPDIVAPGSRIFMPVVGGGWAQASGTSFATPIVAGGAALLIDMGQTLGYNTDGKVIKSVLLNSAEKLSGWSHTPRHPLDYGQGAGQMDLERAHGQYAAGEQAPGAVAGVGWDRGEAAAAAESLYLFDLPAVAGEQLTATLVWDRIVNTDTENLKSVNYSLDHLTNLDLFLYHADDLTTPIASSISTIDNVEHLYLSLPQAGRYALGVKLTGGAAVETYSLAWDLLTTRVLGDANDSGFVDEADLSVLLANWESDPETITTWSLGDFTGDTDVDDDDLAVMLGNWTGPPPPAATLTALPEPTTAVLLALGALALRRRRRAPVSSRVA